MTTLIEILKKTQNNLSNNCQYKNSHCLIQLIFIINVLYSLAQVFMKCLLRTSDCSRYWGCGVKKAEQNPNSHELMVYSGEKHGIIKINIKL